jgi:acetylornithine/LysW-gamma-L-lysine aminotransferase
MTNIFALESTHSSGVYAKHLIAFVRGEGARLWDFEGREYIDCMAGHGVANLGHAHPKIVAAICEQARGLLTCPETYYNDRRAAAMEKLGSLVPGLGRVFLCNSGTEAVEAALKFARLSTGRTRIIAAMRGFHGRTMGSLSATWNKRYREPFEPLVPGFEHVPYNNCEALEKTINAATAAVLLEVVQGEGGVYLAEVGYLQTAQELCQQWGALLIIDEVQTGFGRTGKLLAIEHSGVTPDLLCLAKSIAAGVPMGAVLIGPQVQNLSPGMHASTFGGNPLACAACLATLQVMEEENLPQQAAEKGAALLAGLREIQSPLIREVRGLGLMIGVELKKKVAPYLQGMADRGVIALPAGLSVVRLLPPLVITQEQIERVLQVMAEVLV